MRQPKDGDMLMLTSGEAAGCLVIVDSDWDYKAPFYPDDLMWDFSGGKVASFIANHHRNDGEFPFHFEIIGRWK